MKDLAKQYLLIIQNDVLFKLPMYFLLHFSLCFQITANLEITYLRIVPFTQMTVLSVTVTMNNVFIAHYFSYLFCWMSNWQLSWREYHLDNKDMQI